MKFDPTNIFKENLSENKEKSGALKQKGNLQFSENDFENAESAYHAALKLLPSRDRCDEYALYKQTQTVDGPDKDCPDTKSDCNMTPPAAHERAVLHGNLSAVQKRLEKFKDAIENANEALRLEVSFKFIPPHINGQPRNFGKFSFFYL